MDIVRQRHPPAADGCTVFIERDGVRRLATVRSFVRDVYRLAPRRAHDTTREKKENDSDGGAMIVVDFSKDDGAENVWRDAPLPDCCVCLKEEAGAALLCRCTVPSVCPQCAGKVTTCPQCRIAVDPSLWGGWVFNSNIYSITAARGKRSCQLFAKTLTNHCTVIEAFLDWRVEDFKMAYMTKTDVPISQQRIIFCGTQLEDGRTLNDHGIERESTLHMALRLSGD